MRIANRQARSKRGLSDGESSEADIDDSKCSDSDADFAPREEARPVAEDTGVASSSGAGRPEAGRLGYKGFLATVAERNALSLASGVLRLKGFVFT